MKLRGFMHLKCTFWITSSTNQIRENLNCVSILGLLLMV